MKVIAWNTSASHVKGMPICIQQFAIFHLTIWKTWKWEFTKTFQVVNKLYTCANWNFIETILELKQPSLSNEDLPNNPKWKKHYDLDHWCSKFKATIWKTNTNCQSILIFEQTPLKISSLLLTSTSTTTFTNFV